MAKFIELEHFNIITGRIDGRRVLNTDAIKELSGPYKIGQQDVVRIHLVGNDFVDVLGTLPEIKNKIEQL